MSGHPSVRKMQRHAFRGMNTKKVGQRVGSEAHIGVYVNESGTLGDIAG
jgi:hypothetical protein